MPVDPRRRLEDLAAEVHRQGAEPERLGFVEDREDAVELVKRDPELEASLAGGDVGMGLGGHVGIDPDADRDDRTLQLGENRQPFELRERLDIDVSHPGRDRGLELLVGLPHAAEHDPVGREAGGEGPQELAPRDDVGAGTEPGEEPEHGEVAVGLDGVADAMGQVAECGIESPVSLPDRGRIVDESRACRPLPAIPVSGTPAHAQGTFGIAGQPRVGEQRRQYARAHIASTVAGRPVQMHVVGASADRNSGSGRQRIVALVCSLISASTAGSPQNPA